LALGLQSPCPAFSSLPSGFLDANPPGPPAVSLLPLYSHILSCTLFRPFHRSIHKVFVFSYMARALRLRKSQQTLTSPKTSS
jgi:hypothetical protein